MANVKELISKLLTYASDCLYLSDVDLEYKKYVLAKVFGVTDSDFELRSTQKTDYLSLRKEVAEYAPARGAKDKEGASFVNYVFALLMPLPSAVNNSFKMIKENISAKSAENYYYSLLKNVGFVEEGVFTPFFEGALALYVKSEPSFTGVDSAVDERKIILDFDEDFCFSYVRRADCAYQGKVAKADGRPVEFTPEVIDRAFEFLDYMPEYFIMGEQTDKLDKLSYYTVGRDSFPLFSAKPSAFLTIDAFPDVEISILNYFAPVVRLCGYNKNALTKLIADVVDAWKNYTQIKLSFKRDKKDKNFASVVSHVLPDGRYCTDIILRVGKSKTDGMETIFSSNRLFVNSYTFSVLLGRVLLAGDVTELVKKSVPYLTGRAKGDISALSSADNELYPICGEIDKTISSFGIVKDAQKAEKALRSVVLSSAETALSDLYPIEDKSPFAIKLFLSTLGIK